MLIPEMDHGDAHDGADLGAWLERKDDTAFRRIVDRHAAMVHAVARRVAGDREADDVAQAAFLILLRHAQRLRRNADVGGWLHVVAVRLALRARRRACRRRQVALEGDVQAQVREPAGDLSPLLDAALARLGERERHAIVLHHLEGVPQAEIARRCGVAAGTVASWLSRGREHLRSALARNGLKLTSAGLLAALAALPAQAASAEQSAAIISAANGGTAPGAAALIAAEGVSTVILASLSAVILGCGVAVAAAVSPPPPPVSLAPGPPEAAFTSSAWRAEDASADLQRAGVRLFRIGGWRPGQVGWATPPEARRQPRPVAAYVAALAAGWGQDVLWLDEGRVAVLGTMQELIELQRRAGAQHASAEAVLNGLEPQDGRPPAAPAAVASEAQEEAARSAFHGESGDAKLTAAILLCSTGDDGAAAFLQTELLRIDGLMTEARRREALDALGAHGGSEAIQVLATHLAEPRHQCQRHAGMVLGRNGEPSAVEVLRRALRSADAGQAVGAACGLEMLGGRSGLELAALALAHADADVRKAGVFGAYRAQGRRALPLIVQASNDADPGVRRMAAFAMSNLGAEPRQRLDGPHEAHPKNDRRDF